MSVAGLVSMIRVTQSSRLGFRHYCQGAVISG